MISVDFKMDKITENKTTNPPIDNKLKIEDFIESPKTSPKLESFIGRLFSLKLFSALILFNLNLALFLVLS